MSFRPSIKTTVAAGNTVIDTADWPVSYTDALLSGETIAIEHTDNAIVEYTISSNYSSDVNGVSQAGSSLITDGWTPSAKVFRHGDTFSVGGVEYTCDVASTMVGVDNCESGWQEFNRTKEDVILFHVSS